MKIKAELTFPAELKDEALICNLCKKFDLVLNILEASFSTDTGWAILVIEGTNTELNKAFKYLIDKGVEIENEEELE